MKPESPTQVQRDWRFWMIFMCVMLSQFITALELVSGLNSSQMVYGRIECIPI
jgi:hypothetical protein